MKYMKRILSLLLAGAMVVGLTACGKDAGSSASPEENKSNETVAQTLGYGYLPEYQEPNVELDWVTTSAM